MAETDDFKSMILAFRVSELQLLLGFAGRNKSGRKEYLQAKALELVKLRSAPIQMKIRELYKKHQPLSRSSKVESDSSSSSNSGGGNNSRNIPTRGFASSPGTMKSYSSSHGGSGSGGGGHGHQSHHGTITRSVSAHNGMSGNSHGGSTAPLDFSNSKYGLQTSTPPSSAYPVHPDVRFRKLPFYHIMAELLKPASLVPTGSSRFQEANFVFHLTPHQAHEIGSSRDLRPGAKLEYAVQVQMRFCLLETSCEQDDNFPPSICVKVNGKMCPLPNPIPTNKPGVEPKRPSRPVNVTFLCKLSPTVSNQINVSWASEYGRGYAIGVYLVKRLTSANLIQKLRAQGVRNADHTRAMIKEKLAHDADSEIATTSLRVSLMCPLGKMRMLIPCRATTCTHLQCFDASLYIQMNEKKPTWMCPVCDKLAPFDALVIDGLFMEIFNSTPDCNEIQFHDNGAWSPLQQKRELHVIGSPSANKTPNSLSASPNASAPLKLNIAAAKFEVVDLTLDSTDDDEDCEPPRKSPAPYPSDSNSSCNSVRIAITTSVSSNGNSISTTTLSSQNYSSSSSNSNSGMGGGGGGHGSASANSNAVAGNTNLGRGSVSGRTNRTSSSPSFRDMPLLDSSSQLFYPPVSSPYADFLQSSNPTSLFSYPGYDLFNLLGQNDLDRQFSLSSNLQSTNSSLSHATSHRTSAPPASPDVISLD